MGCGPKVRWWRGLRSAREKANAQAARDNVEEPSPIWHVGEIRELESYQPTSAAHEWLIGFCVGQCKSVERMSSDWLPTDTQPEYTNALDRGPVDAQLAHYPRLP